MTVLPFRMSQQLARLKLTMLADHHKLLHRQRERARLRVLLLARLFGLLLPGQWHFRAAAWCFARHRVDRGLSLKDDADIAIITINTRVV